MRDERYPYWGVCDVESCDNENCNGGGCWRETGYWRVCATHSAAWRRGEPQPAMKREAIEREATRNKKTGELPLPSDTALADALNAIKTQAVEIGRLKGKSNSEKM